MRISTVASGSSGNCIYVGSDNTHLLVDAGISKKRTETGLNANDIDMKDISGILITHEHTDILTGLELFQENMRYLFTQHLRL